MLLAALLATHTGLAEGERWAVRIHVAGGDTPTYTVGRNNRILTFDELSALISRIAKLDTDQMILIAVEDDVNVSQLLPLLLAIRESGLKNVALNAPSVWQGKQGYITLSADITPRAITGDVIGHEDYGGFSAVDLERLELPPVNLNEDSQ